MSVFTELGGEACKPRLRGGRVVAAFLEKPDMPAPLQMYSVQNQAHIG